MWGDPEKALALGPSDALSAILLQICGPAHIAWADTRWQELLHAYGVWIHVEARLAIVEQATQSLVVHASQSSNLAALCWHVTRLVSDLLVVPTHGSHSTSTSQQHSAAVNDFSNRIAMVAKARATAGSVNLLRLLVHAVIEHSCRQLDQAAYLQQVFTYKSRDSNREHLVAADLVEALIQFLIQLNDHHDSSQSALALTLPELYDATTCALQLLLVLFSSQLYSPFQSSLERPNNTNKSGYYFWDLFIQQAHSVSSTWTPRQLLSALLEWTIHRPAAPERSVQHHLQQLCRSVAQAQTPQCKLGDDGMYEAHLVVMAEAPASSLQQQQHEQQQQQDVAGQSHYNPHQLLDTRRHNFLYDATKGVVMTLSSTILLLPLRLLSLVSNLFHNKDGNPHDYDQHYLEWRRRQQQQRKEHCLTSDVLWLTNSPVADLAACLLLLLSNNERRLPSTSESVSDITATQQRQSPNPFRDELANLTDNRWQEDGNGLPDLPNLLVLGDQSEEFSVAGESTQPLLSTSEDTIERIRNGALSSVSSKILSVNFEALFKSFGQTAHTEVGALLLYTLLQSSKSFADSIAVRSDLDTLVLPMLRTLYLATSLKHFAALDFASTGISASRQQANDPSEAFSASNSQQAVSVRSCPFRSLSQLYVIIILLLLFSQDLSFGSDAFRRVVVASVPWYKERNIKDVSLGSMLILCLLRSLTFNLNRIHDAFLLSNCCAILMNLSTSVSDLHEYAAMRLASVTLSSMKRYSALKQENPNVDEDDLSSPTAMHGEVCRTLLRVVKQCFATKIIERNLHLVYAMVYHQVEFKKLIAAQDAPFSKGEVDRIQKVIVAASSVLEKDSARTSAKALKVLSENTVQIRGAIAERKRQNDAEAFTFTYEEEADPETFFVPYVWEVIVCCATASSIDWTKPEIKVFPLLEDAVADELISVNNGDTGSRHHTGNFSKDLTEVA